MTLPLPKLDARRFDDLLSEALLRLPLHTPEYTNHNESDPGRAILEANAYLTETLLYQINRVPDQNYVAFLNLLGITPRAATAAQTELAFDLKDLNTSGDPLIVDIPLGTQVAVDAPDLDQNVVFETDLALRAFNAQTALALIPLDDQARTWKAVTRFDADERTTDWLHAFHPFGMNEAAGRQFIFALALRPKAETVFSEDRLPSGTLDLFVEATEVFEADAAGAPLAGPVSISDGPTADAPDAPPPVTWEIFAAANASALTFDGTDGWEPLSVSFDGTDGLRRSGHVTVELPSDGAGVRMDALPADSWSALGSIRAPKTADDLKAILKSDALLADELKAALELEHWTAMGVIEADFNAVLSDCTTGADLLAALDDLAVEPNPAGISQLGWAALNPVFAAPDVPLVEGAGEEMEFASLYFFRVTLEAPLATPRLLNRLRLNTVSATAASTRKDEKLGVSTGRPAQTFTLAQSPVYTDPNTGAPDLALTVTSGGDVQTWTRVDEFYGLGPVDRVFHLDPVTGQISFGDGRAHGIGGAIPPRDAVVRVARYRFGGGGFANVGQGTVSALKGSLRGVAGVSNPRGATGGADAETLEDVKLRAPSTLRRRDRAVSADDFADLARETPGAAIHKAFAVAAHVPTDTGFAQKAGAVSVVVLPRKDHPTPQPNEADLAAVRDWLNPRRMVTTELHVIGPRYFNVHRLRAKLKVDANADFRAVSDAAKQAIDHWLNPITGGEDGTGWPFGADVFHADLYDVLLAVEGVRRVSGLSVSHDAIEGGYPSDVIPVPAGFLPSVQPGALSFEVSYV